MRTKRMEAARAVMLCKEELLLETRPMLGDENCACKKERFFETREILKTIEMLGDANDSFSRERSL